jgi:UDP-N-acetylmuramoyl-tripeptide--D-alanyl-D-alanine ligase
MFFALKGPRFNANAFAQQALDQGCKWAVVDDPQAAVDERFLLVPDVLRALQELATFHRRRYDFPVVGITGSNGKTTTKELLHAVLKTHLPTLATEGNLNNHIGVPLTLLRITEQHRVAIVEMGANKVGDVAELAAIAEPTHGLITNIGKAHLEGFGGYAGVVRAKTEMYTHLARTGGLAFVHRDDDLLVEKSQGQWRHTYGTLSGADLRGSAAQLGAFLAIEWSAPDGMHHANTRLIGNYNLPNALAAVCIGAYFGVPHMQIAQGLSDYTPTNNRSQFLDTGKNHLVLDAYNANPSSMAAALENFAQMTSDRPKVAILGGMKELGTESAEEHERLALLVRSLSLRALVVGSEFEQAARALQLPYCNTAEQALERLQEKPLSGALVLIKGSRSVGLEALVPAL